MTHTTNVNKQMYKDISSFPKSGYLPSDDTYLMIDTLKKDLKNKQKDMLEIGFGSGIISLSFYKFFDNVDCCDINKEIVSYFIEYVKKNNLRNINVFYSDLFKNIPKKYDVIVFNPPYVPSNKIDLSDICSLATDGGKDGSEIIVDFLQQLNLHLKKNGVCYLLISSLNNLKNLEKIIIKDFVCDVINKKKLFFEELLILKIKKR